MKEDIAVSTISGGLPRRFNISRIVALTDFSQNSEKTVDYAIQLARRIGAKLTLLHVVPKPGALDYSMEGISIQEFQGWEEEVEQKLKEELSRARLEYQEVDAVKGSALHPRDQIVKITRDLSADLLVLSTHGYTGWRHFLFGSDAEKILEHAPCPVLVVR